MNKIYIKTLLLILIILPLSQCTKENISNTQTNNSPNIILIQKEKYHPFEAIIFKMNTPWKDAPDSISIGQTFVKISNQDSFLMGICPNILPGEYDVKLNAQFSYKIIILPPISVNPTDVYDSLMLISESNKLGSEDAEQINYWQNVIQKEWPKLNDADKIKVSQFLTLNGFLNNETIDQGNLSYLDSLKGRNNFFNIDEAQKKFSQSVIKSKVLLVTGIAAIAVGVYNAHTGIGLISVAAGCVILYKYKNTLYKTLDNWKFSAIQFNDFNTLENRSVPSFKNGETLPFSLKANCSNISQSDQSEIDVAWLFTNLNTIQFSINKLNYLIDNFLSFLPGVKKIDWEPNKYISPTEYRKTLPIYYSNISISNISNPNIKLVLIEGANGEINIKTESELQDTTNFDFTIKYKSKHGFNPKNNSKIFSGKYIPKNINGLWNCINLTDFNEKKMTNQDCDGITFQYVSEHINELMQFNISKDSVFFTIKETAKEYTINRPQKCGGEFYSEIPLNPVYKFKIAKRYPNKFDLVGPLLNGYLQFKISDPNNITFDITFFTSGVDQTSINNIKCIRKI